MGIEAAKLQVKFETNAMTVSGEVKGLDEQVKRTSDNGTKNVGTLTKGFNAFQGEVLPAVAIITTFGAAVKKAFEYGEEGAQIEQLKDSASAMAESLGGDLDEIVARVRAATLNTISDYAIMQGSSRAMALGLGADAEQLAALAEIAAARGRLMGESSQAAFNDIVTGIGRMSPMILDNLGITIDAEATYDAYAAKIGKSADALTGAEKKQALMNRTIEEGKKILADTGGLVANNTTSYEQAAAAMSNALDILKAKIAPFMADTAMGAAYVLTFRDNIVAANEDFTRTSLESGLTYKNYLETAARAEDQYTNGAISHLQERLDYLQSLRDAGNAGSLEYQMTLEQVDEGLQKLGLMPQTIYEAKQMTDSWVGVWEQNHKKIVETTDAIVYLDSVTQAGIGGQIQKIYADYNNNLEELQQKNSGLNNTLEYLNDTYAAAPLRIKELTQSLLENEEAQRISEGSNKDLIKQHKDMEEELGKWNNVLESGRGNIESYTGKVRDNEQAQEDLKEQTAAAVREFLFQQASAGLTGEALYEMAVAMGVMDEESYNAALLQQQLRDKFDAGTLSAQEYANQTSGLGDAINALKDKNVKITVTTVQEYITKRETASNTSSGSFDSSAEIPGVNGYYSSDGQWVSFQNAVGTDFVVPDGFSNDNFVLPLAVRSGERVRVTPANETSQEGSGRGDVINIYPATAQFTEDDLQRVMRQRRRR